MRTGSFSVNRAIRWCSSEPASLDKLRRFAQAVLALHLGDKNYNGWELSVKFYVVGVSHKDTKKKDFSQHVVVTASSPLRHSAQPASLACRSSKDHSAQAWLFDLKSYLKLSLDFALSTLQHIKRLISMVPVVALALASLRRPGASRPAAMRAKFECACKNYIRSSYTELKQRIARNAGFWDLASKHNTFFLTPRPRYPGGRVRQCAFRKQKSKGVSPVMHICICRRS